MATNSVEVQVFDSDFSFLVRESVTYEIKMESRSRSKLRTIICICILLAISGIIYFGYFCPDHICALTSRETGWSDWTFRSAIKDKIVKPLLSYSEPTSVRVANGGLSYDDVINENFQFDMNAHDVMVFLHIQKTGGTSFGKHLVRDLDLELPCSCPRKRKRCRCFRPNTKENWLFSRYTTGWRCGLHADWTELTSCVDAELDKSEGEKVKRRYFYVTLLREPVSRYVSEFRHVQRGATWRASRHWCGGKPATKDVLPMCYKGKSWEYVTLDQFMECPHNLAANRQTRMLSDLALVGCYNQSYMSADERNKIMLASAKKNLMSMAYFGLTEYQKISQYIFEETFNLRFAVPFEQHNETFSSVTLSVIRPDQIAAIERINKLDLELYAFAKKLLFERFEHLKSKDSQFKEKFAHLGEITSKQDTFNWDQVIYEDNNITQN